MLTRVFEGKVVENMVCLGIGARWDRMGEGYDPIALDKDRRFW